MTIFELYTDDDDPNEHPPGCWCEACRDAFEAERARSDALNDAQTPWKEPLP